MYPSPKTAIKLKSYVLPGFLLSFGVRLTLRAVCGAQDENDIHGIKAAHPPQKGQVINFFKPLFPMMKPFFQLFSHD